MSDDLPQILLIAPNPDDATFTDGRLAAALDKLLRSGTVPKPAVLLLRDGPLEDAGFLEAIAPLVERAQGEGVAVLLENRVDLVSPSGCDGVHITLREKGGAIKKLRQRLGDDLIIGAGCGTSRHAAMEAGEQGADYIAFGAADDPPGDGTLAADPELVDWWAHWMTPPLVAFGADDPAKARALAALGADFLALPPAFWLEAPDPAAAFTGLLEALAQPD
ncbi:thiamine phosphate synthase [Pelagibius litoralis]|uniref:Thiamine phosphate synthase n=1 Tax=Pelagibius litoralis TaxID=374515 RepID=A0A967F000_9PROT|nr:thiamine phosphate synthase [Pelagibius litoralis]NIA70508.1 thiamine phosphate synthase [Pelagibius litoralis]